jgi:hypothetical protein
MLKMVKDIRGKVHFKTPCPIYKRTSPRSIYQLTSIASTIILNGIDYNYAPVLDVSSDNRSLQSTRSETLGHQYIAKLLNMFV